MATRTGIKQIGKPGGLVEPGIQKYGVWEWIDTAVDTYQKYKPLVDTAVSIGKGYLDYKTQKELNELSEEAYNQYMREKQAAAQDAQAAVDLNLTPMEITNIPTTKADVTDFTAVAARGGLMSIPNRQRKRYATGPNEVDVMEFDEEVITPDYLMKEEGVQIGPMASGNYTEEEIEAYENYKYDMEEQRPGMPIMDIDDFLRFYYSGKNKSKMMAKGPEEGDTTLADEMPTWSEAAYEDEFMKPAANGGIIGLRHGGRPGYNVGVGPVGRGFMTEQEASIGNPGNAEMYADEITEFQPKVIIMTADGIVAISKEDYDKVMSGEITQEEALANAGYEGGIEKIEVGNAKGGLPKRARKANGGIMDLGGLEKDYRFSGGFVPIGEYEKKDDVPARLSKNEFVFTADAVRAAGGGSINKGAQRMYNTMKHLEAQPTAKRKVA